MIRVVIAELRKLRRLSLLLGTIAIVGFIDHNNGIEPLV